MAFEPNVPVQNEHAVRCSIVSKPVSMVEYIKTISSVIGATHILAVFEETDSVKVFFDDKRHVDRLLQNCLHVMGRHVKVDYVVPPGVKLILSNVDPTITNFDIVRLLTAFGTIVSPIFRPPISDDVELCHISYGVRYVYMILLGCIPERLEFKYGDQFSYIKVDVVENSDLSLFTSIKEDNFEETEHDVELNSAVQIVDTTPGSSGIDTSSIQEAVDPILVSVQSVPEMNTKEQQTDSAYCPTPGTNSTSSDQSSLVKDTNKVVIIKRARGRPRQTKYNKMTATSRAARRIKKNVKHKWVKRPYRRTKYYHQKPETKFHKSSVFSHVSKSELPDLIKDNDQSNSVRDGTIKVLDNRQLLMYLDEVKRHRAPLELAKRYIGNNCDTHKIGLFIDQLLNYKKKQDDINLKCRIWRLIRTIKDSLNSASESDHA